MSLVVVDPGLASRVVDFGRPHVRSLGVAVGGAADRLAMSLGNGLVGNAADAPALEICLKGPVLRAEKPLTSVLLGAPFDMSTATQRLRTGTTFNLAVGEELHINGTPRGMRAYLCVRGGIQSPVVLNSHSALENIRAGEVLPCEGHQHLRPRYLGPEALAGLRCEFERENVVRVLPGLQADWFPQGAFFDQTYTVTPNLDRMGIRLQGSPLAWLNKEMVSEPVCPGAVQVTRDGQCIILGVDGQTIGGYPKIAQVIRADIDRLGQLRPGTSVHFQEVTQPEGEEAHRCREEAVHAWLLRCRISFGA